VAVPKLLDGVRLGKVKPAAVRLLDRVGLGNRTQHRPSELSGGQMQRAAVAQALMMDPPLILADEPTGEVAHEEGHRRLVVMVAHNPEATACFGTGPQVFPPHVRKATTNQGGQNRRQPALAP
jgi:putative ABC transport system ATP-binding protein